MKYLTRNKHYRKNEPSKDAKKLYLICEGEVNEINYFKFFEKFSKNLEIITIKPEDGKTDPVKLMERSKVIFFGDSKNGIKPEYELNITYGDSIWFIIDTDNWNIGGKIEKLKLYCAENDSNGYTWNVVQSNPCFEQWQYYHFFDEKPQHNEVLGHVSFKDFVSNKIRGGFDNRKHPINIDLAVKNAEVNYSQKDGQPDIYSTELHILGDIICELISEDLALAKRIALST